MLSCGHAGQVPDRLCAWHRPGRAHGPADPYRLCRAGSSVASAAGGIGLSQIAGVPPVRAVLDTCVIYPTVMRQMLLGVAAQGVFTPLWSARIIEEWQRAAVKLGPEGVAQAGAEAAMLAMDWPEAEVSYPPSLDARLW